MALLLLVACMRMALRSLVGVAAAAEATPSDQPTFVPHVRARLHVGARLPRTAFKVADVGNCPTGTWIEEFKMCEAAAASLGLPSTSTSVSYAEYPHGCYVKKSTGKVYLNAAGNQKYAKTDRVSVCVGKWVLSTLSRPACASIVVVVASITCRRKLLPNNAGSPTHTHTHTHTHTCTHMHNFFSLSLSRSLALSFSLSLSLLSLSLAFFVSFPLSPLSLCLAFFVSFHLSFT